MEDLTGLKFGRLKVEKFFQRKGSRYLWMCICDCGNTTKTSRSDLVGGKSKSCGCLAKEGFSLRNKKHGMSDTRIYKIYLGMKKRCNNSKTKNFKNYGAKGIKVSKEWEESFENFYKDMFAGYDDTLTLDRIDNSKGYSKDNCRWVTMQVQNYNKGKTKANKSGVVGVHYCKIRKKWLASITKNYKSNIVGSYSDFNDAVKARKGAESEYYK